MPIYKKLLENYYSQGRKLTPGFYIFLLIFISFLLTFQTAIAQENETLILQPPDSSEFPEITVSFKLPYSQYEKISTLQLDHLDLIENGKEIPPKSLTRNRRGIHFTLAVNPGTPLGLHDASGISTYEKLQEALIDWAESRSSLIDDSWTLIGDEIVLISNSKDRNLWIESIKNYQPDFRTMQPQITSLELAVDRAGERIVPFGVDKAILFVTPAPLPDQIEVINKLSRQAVTYGIQVNVWMVDDPYFLTNDQGGALIELAKNTGGNFFHFTGSEIIPNPESYLVDLGYYFTLVYESSIRSTGTNSLRIDLSAEESSITGESTPFYVEVKPPNPILISPPANINRTQIIGETGDLRPFNQNIEIMVEFPDCHPRPITVSRLYVDGEMVDERISPPFDNLNWDLTSISSSSLHEIQVEVEDSLGLSARTILTPVNIEVLIPEPEQNFSTGQIGSIIFGVLIVVSLIVLVSWLVRRYWQSEKFRTFLPDRFIQANKMERNADLQDNLKNEVIAELIPLDNPAGNIDDIFHITHAAVRIGSDPDRAELIINDPSCVSMSLAIIKRSEEAFFINDMGSTNGTWVNYQKIYSQPVKIQTGDILHFGSCGFRFVITADEPLKKVSYLKYEPIL